MKSKIKKLKDLMIKDIVDLVDKSNVWEKLNTKQMFKKNGHKIVDTYTILDLRKELLEEIKIYKKSVTP